MFDSTDANAIPLTAQLVAGYVDGIYAWSSANWSRFPNAVHVPIACFATTNAGTVLDIETGCSTPGQAPHWVLMRRAVGVDPTVYVNWSNWTQTRAAFDMEGVAQPHYWLASYDGKAEVPAGTVAKQYANSALSGGHYDLSAVADHWPGVDRPGTTAGSEIIPGGTMTRGQKVNAVENWYAIYLHLNYGDADWPGGADKAGPDITQWANQIQDDGENLDAIRGQFIAAVKTGAPARYAWFESAKHVTTGVAGPAGPAGSQGPIGPPGVMVPHEHTVTGTAK